MKKRINNVVKHMLKWQLNFLPAPKDWKDEAIEHCEMPAPTHIKPASNDKQKKGFSYQN